MSSDISFLVKEEKRINFIDQDIIAKLPENVRESAKTRATKIVNAYVGQDVNALSVLAYAAECGRFEEFAEKLENHYQESLAYVRPDMRKRSDLFPGAFRAEMFFVDCYRSMGISE